MLKETWSRWHITEIKFGAVVFHHILHAVVCHGCSIPVWHAGLLQVLLPLLLALAALHGHLEQPPAPHAQPEEQGLQLERMNPHTMKGWRKSPSTGRGCPPRRARVPDVPQFEGTWHSTRHWGYHCRNVHFCTCYIFAVHSGTMHSDLVGRDKGPFTLMHFPGLVARQRDGSQPKVKKWMKMPFLFSFCLHVLHSEEQSRESHCRSLANAIQCL